MPCTTAKELDTSNNVISDDSIDATTTVTVTILDVEEDGVLTLSDDEPGVGTRVDHHPLRRRRHQQHRQCHRGRCGSGRGRRTGGTGWTNISGATTPHLHDNAGGRGLLPAGECRRTGTRRGGGKTAFAITTERVFGENQRPTFPSTESGARTVAENTGAGMSVGDPVAAEDMDDDRLTYSLSGTDAAAFSIVTTTGQLRTLEPLDFEDEVAATASPSRCTTG